jgi:hypothetical protein
MGKRTGVKPHTRKVKTSTGGTRRVGVKRSVRNK